MVGQYLKGRRHCGLYLARVALGYVYRHIIRKTIMRYFGVQPLFLDLQTSVVLCRLRGDR